MSDTAVQFVPVRYVTLLPKINDQLIAKIQPSVNKGKMMVELQDGAYLETDIPSNWTPPNEGDGIGIDGEAVVSLEGELLSYKITGKPKKVGKPEPTGRKSPLGSAPDTSWKL